MLVKAFDAKCPQFINMLVMGIRYITPSIFPLAVGLKNIAQFETASRQS